jgi:hypothetical protein
MMNIAFFLREDQARSVVLLFGGRANWSFRGELTKNWGETILLLLLGIDIFCNLHDSGGGVLATGSICSRFLNPF